MREHSFRFSEQIEYKHRCVFFEGTNNLHIQTASFLLNIELCRAAVDAAVDGRDIEPL